MPAMSHKVYLRNFSTVIEVPLGDTILDVALDKGLDYPHGCRSGNCGACKSVLHSGKVELQEYSDFALTEEEKAAGQILCCRAMPQADCEVSFSDPDERADHPRRIMDCKVVALTRATHDITIVRLEVASGGPYAFSAGQYASVTFGNLPPRDYSMANHPEDPILEFHVRLTQGGTVSAFVNQQLKLGDMVLVEGPFGVSYLREKHTGPIVACAGGSGLAPIKSIIDTALSRGLRQPIKLYFGARDERDVYFEQHFKALAAKHSNLEFQTVLSEPAASTKRRTGLMVDVVRQDFKDLDGAKAYLAGPPIMVETCVSALEKLGVRREDCHADAEMAAKAGQPA
jgi:CDP-4-dehydro-6-deoxyglucose reductase/ferredoxin-NAD(P)+ reductase (naphthalene dioxygenase ferredoxin-specific)